MQLTFGKLSTQKIYIGGRVVINIYEGNYLFVLLFTIFYLDITGKVSRG